MKKMPVTTLFLGLTAFLILGFVNASQAKMEVFDINAQRNAVDHNNIGIIYMRDRMYAPAIKEFQMAILLDPDTQASSVYYSNLANCYMRIGYPALAQEMLEKAIKYHPMQFTYYEDLTVALKRQDLLDLKLKYYEKDAQKNPLSKIMTGLILVEQGKNDEGMAKLYEFVFGEPDLIITSGVKQYIKKHDFGN